MNRKADFQKNQEEQNTDNKFPFSDSKLILFNDDINEFSYVIKCIIEILDCDDQQAEQLTLLAHCKGSAIVKEGSAELLLQLSTLLKIKGLKSAVKQNDLQ